MLKPAVGLDAQMSAAAVLQRLALRGFWMDPNHPAASARIASFATRLEKSVDVVTKALARDVRLYGAAVRLQAGTRVLWFVMELERVLENCTRSAPERLLREVLDLDEKKAHPILQLARDASVILSTGVVMDNDTPIAVWLGPPVPSALGITPPEPPPRWRSAVERGAQDEESIARDTQIWPRMDAPPFVRAGQRFQVTVGLGRAQQSGVSAAPLILALEPDSKQIEITVQLSASAELSAPDGWTRTMSVPLNDISSVEVCFELIGAEPVDPNLPHLTMLEVRYVHAGAVCATAAKPLVILHSRAEEQGGSVMTEDQAKLEALPIVVTADQAVPDLTIEITKSDRSSTLGRYVCQCCSPHRLATTLGPFPMDLGQDASTFARAIVDEITLFAGNPLIETTLEGLGKLIAQRLPAGVFAALREVAQKTAPAAPAVMIVSSEPYVPWEIAWVEPAIDVQRPNFLGSQVVLGRWLRDYSQGASTVTPSPSRPAVHPSSHLSIRNVALVAAWYKASSGLKRLPQAEAEVAALASGIDGISLPASGQVMKDLLRAVDLERENKRVGPMHALHFSGHGTFDPAKPDAAALFLEDGVPMRSTMFRATRFAPEQQPMMFLNACMLGIGGELLGDMAGFPGNSLRGGFGAVIGALWEIEDSVAREFALEFWRRALPPPPAKGEPIGSILRDLRAKWMLSGAATPTDTYLAYVYYGHPNLTLQRVAPETTA